MNNFDLELSFIKLVFGLKEVENKEYSCIDGFDSHLVYIFSNYYELIKYFDNYNIKVDESILDLCVFKITKKGNIIVYKDLCDHIINRCKMSNIVSYDYINDNKLKLIKK